MKGGIFSIDGDEACIHSMETKIPEENDEPLAKKVNIITYVRFL